MTREVLHFEERAFWAATGDVILPALFRQGLAIAQLMDGSAEQVVRLLIELYENGAAQQVTLDTMVRCMNQQIALLRLLWQLNPGEKLSFEQFAATMRAEFLLSVQAMPDDDALADPPRE